MKNNMFKSRPIRFNKRTTYNQSQLDTAVNMVLKNRLSLRAASHIYKIPFSTLRTRKLKVEEHPELNPTASSSTANSQLQDTISVKSEDQVYNLNDYQLYMINNQSNEINGIEGDIDGDNSVEEFNDLDMNGSTSINQRNHRHRAVNERGHHEKYFQQNHDHIQSESENELINSNKFDNKRCDLNTSSDKNQQNAIMEMFLDLKNQIKNLNEQNSLLAKSIETTVQSKLNEFGGILLPMETIESYFNKVEELYTKLARSSKSLDIHRMHVTEKTVPNALSCFQYPKPLFPEDQSYVDKYNELLAIQQNMTLNLNIEFLGRNISSLNNEISNLKNLLKAKCVDVEQRFQQIKKKVEEKLKEEFDKIDSKCKNSIREKYEAIN